MRRTGPTYQLTPSELAATTMVTSGAITKRLDRLERAGLIERSPDPTDRRGTLIGLTDAGRELIDSVTGPHLANEARLLESLTAEERDQLAALLRKLSLGLPPL